MARKASQAKPLSPWPTTPTLASRQPSSTSERASSRRLSYSPVSPLSVDSFKSADASPIASERSIPPVIKSPATAKDNPAHSALALIGPISSPTTPQDTMHHDPPTAESAQAAATEESRDPVLPMTPNSADGLSPASTVVSLTAEEAPPVQNLAVNKDLAVVEELLGTMRQMLGTLGSTVDTLGEQTIKVATLPAAMAAVHQIASARDQLDDQQTRQEERMMEFKKLLLEEVRTRLYARLKDTASAIVKEIIQKEIAHRVRKRLHEQIPQSMRDEVLLHKHQIMEVQVSLHNSEARRHNALIRSNSLDEPLRPLLRLPPSLGDIFPRDTSLDGEQRTPSATGDSGKTSASVASLDARGQRKALGSRMATHATVQGRRTRLSAKDLDTPTPSPLFPRDLAALARLGPDDAKELMRDYGLVKTRRITRRTLHRRKKTLDDPFLDTEPEDPSGDATETEPDGVVELVEEDEPRDETLNRFLQFIGVTFRIVPTMGTPSRAKGLIAASSLRPR